MTIQNYRQKVHELILSEAQDHGEYLSASTVSDLIGPDYAIRFLMESKTPEEAAQYIIENSAI